MSRLAASATERDASAALRASSADSLAAFRAAMAYRRVASRLLTSRAMPANVPTWTTAWRRWWGDRNDGMMNVVMAHTDPATAASPGLAPPYQAAKMTAA